MRLLISLLTLYVCLSCSTDKIKDEVTLEAFLSAKEIVLDNVIACAASNELDKQVSVFLYPRNKATNFPWSTSI